MRTRKEIEIDQKEGWMWIDQKNYRNGQTMEIFEKYIVRMESECKGSPDICDCEKCLKIKGEW